MDRSIIAKIARDCLRLDRGTLPRADVLTVAHDIDRSLNYRGRWYSPLINTIEDDLRARNVECVSVARIISRIKGNKAYGRVYSPEGAFARALIGKRLLGLATRGRYPYSKMEEKVWARVLDQTSARKVLAIQPSRELCVACRTRGIWVADIQHGVISDSHPWYGERFRGGDPIEWLPDAFICWDEGSRQVVDRWAPAKGVSTLVTGNRWVVRFLQRQAGDKLVDEFLSEYDVRSPNPTGKPAILVALSWGESNIPNGFMVDALRDAIRSTADKYHWQVRLHPNQLNGFATHEGQRFAEFFRNNLEGYVEWETATQLPLPVILRHTDLAVCWNSSVAIEAAQMGVHTALLNPWLREPDQMGDYYQHYRGLGMVHLVEDRTERIIAWIEATLGKKTLPENFAACNAEYQRLLGFLAGRSDP